MQRRFFSRLALGAGALVLAAGVSGVTAISASAGDPEEPDPALIATYDINGSAHVQKSNFDVPIGPTNITVDIAYTSSYLASLPLPPKVVKFKAFGYLPVKAKVYFTQVAPVTGDITFEGTNTIVTAVAKYVVTLRDVTVGGAAAKVGDNCQTRYPITVDVGTNGLPFDLFSGGDLNGTFDIGKFEHCGTSTDLANIIVPSNNNTIKLHLDNFQVENPNLPQAQARKLVKQRLTAKGVKK